MKIQTVLPPTAASNPESLAAKSVQAPQATVDESARSAQTGLEEHDPRPKGEIQQTVEKMNKAAEALNQALKFKITEGNRIIIKVVDTASGEVLREIPPERLAEALQHMQNAMGVLVDSKV